MPTAIALGVKAGRAVAQRVRRSGSRRSTPAAGGAYAQAGRAAYWLPALPLLGPALAGLIGQCSDSVRAVFR